MQRAVSHSGEQRRRQQRPVARQKRQRYYSEGADNASKGSSASILEVEEPPPFPHPGSSRFTLVATPVPEKKQEDVSEKEAPKKGCLGLISRFLDLSLAPDPLFLTISASVMCMAFGTPHLLFFLPSSFLRCPFLPLRIRCAARGLGFAWESFGFTA